MRQDTPDSILYNGRFLSLAEGGEVYRSIAVKDGVITAARQDDSLCALRGFGTEMLDLGGKTVVPGFIDSNVHAVQSGLDHFGVSIEAGGRAELLKAIQKVADGFQPGEAIWITCLKGGMVAEGQLNRWELDKVSGPHPIIVSVMEFHTTLVNTQAYNMLEIPASLSGVEKDGRGMPTGILRGEASGLARGKAYNRLVSNELRHRALAHTMQRAAACGITTLCAMEGGFFFSDADYDVVKQYQHSFPIDLVLYRQAADVEAAEADGAPNIGGNIYVDGTLGSRNAALFEPYEDQPENCGTLYFSQADLDQFVDKAHARGMNIALSCIGERAIAAALDAYQKAFARHGANGHRHRIEHFVLPTDAQIEQCAQMGIVLSMQPGYDAIWGGETGMYARNVGPRWTRVNPVGKALRMGVHVAGSSESNVTPLEPLLGIHAAANHHVPEHRVPVLEALKLYTVAGAYANFIDDRTGRIKPGYFADLCVLSGDPLAVPPEKLRELAVLQTYKKGKLVFERMGPGL